MADYRANRGLSPGDFNIFTRVTGDNIIPWDYEFDFLLELPNSPPTVEIRTNLNGRIWNLECPDDCFYYVRNSNRS